MIELILKDALQGVNLNLKQEAGTTYKRCLPPSLNFSLFISLFSVTYSLTSYTVDFSSL